MASIFEFLSNNGEASPGILMMLLLDPVINALGGLVFFIIALWHYLKTKNKGSLLILASITISFVSAMLVESVLETVDDELYSLIDVASNLLETLLFLVTVYGFYLICKSSVVQTNAHQKI